jgi:uncharacterized protein involved in exopolysaccharide biosynthesis
MTLTSKLLGKKIEVIIIFFVLFIFVIIKVFFFPIYESTAIVMIDKKKGPTSLEAEPMDLRENIGYIRIHSELLKSEPVLRDVVMELELYRDTSLWKKETASNISIADTTKEKSIRLAIDALRKKYITIDSPPFTNLIEIKVKYKKPESAAEIANTLVEKYLQWNINFIHREVSNIIGYLEREVSVARERLRDSEITLQNFRDENKIISLPDEIKAYFETIPEEIKFHYQVIKDKEIKLLELEVELSRLEELYTEESPQIKYMGKRITEFKKDLDEEIAKTKFTEDYISKLKDVPTKEIKLAWLVREVKINEALYTFLLGEQEKARLIKAKQTNEDVIVVSRALVPLKPKGRLVSLLLGLVISLTFAVALPLFPEIRKKLI